MENKAIDKMTVQEMAQEILNNLKQRKGTEAELKVSMRDCALLRAIASESNNADLKNANCAIFDVSKMLTEIIVSLNNGEKIKAIKCSECDCYFEEKEIQIQGDLDTCDDCLCPE